MVLYFNDQITCPGWGTRHDRMFSRGSPSERNVSSSERKMDGWVELKEETSELRGNFIIYYL